MTVSASNNKRIAKNTLLLYFRMFFIMIVNLYTSRIVLQVLGVNDFGIYNIVGGVIVLFSFFNNALLTSTQRFLNYEIGQNDLEAQKKIFKTSMSIYLLFALIIFLLAESLGLWFLNTQLNIPNDRMKATNWVFQFSLVTFIINVIRIPYNATVIAQEKMSFYAYLSIVEVILKLLIVYLLLMIAFDKLVVYASLITAVTAIIWIAYRSYCLKQFTTCQFSFYYDKETYHKMLSFSGWSFFGSVTNLSVNQGVNILLNIFYGVTISASVGISNQIRGAINNFLVNFQIAFNPQIVKSYANKENERFQTLIIYSSKYSYYLMFLICIPFCINARFIILKWLGVLSDYLIEFTIGSLFILIVDSISAPLGFAIQATGNIKKYQIIYSCISLLQFPLSYLLLKMGFSPIYVFVSWCVISLINYCWKICFVTNQINMSTCIYVRKVIAPILVTSGASIATLYFFPIPIQAKTWTHFISSTLFIIIYLLIIIGITGLNKKEKSFFINLVKTKISLKKQI